MPTVHVTPELIERVDLFGAQFNLARMHAVSTLPGNPFDVEIRIFGNGGVATKARHALLRGRNRIYNFGTSDLHLLDELLAFYRSDGLTCKIWVPHSQLTSELFCRFSQAGLWSTGNGTVPVIISDGQANGASLTDRTNLRIRLSEDDEKELYLDIFQQAFADREEHDPEYRAFQWAEDSLPGSPRYIAEIGGRPVGMASFPIVEGIAFFGTAGVIPKYRGLGVQLAMIQRRIADAPALGCGLVLGGSSPGTTEYRNFQRAGLQLIPTGSIWRETR